MEANSSSLNIINASSIGEDVAVVSDQVVLVPPALDSPRPVSKADRIQTVDLIRGLALLGILMMNMPGFGFPGTRYPLLLTKPDSPDFYALGAIFVAFDGTMRALFSMLFGAGMVLFTSNKQELTGGPSVVDYYYRRLLWLVLFGVFNAYVLLWGGRYSVFLWPLWHVTLSIS